ncbi:hypothetical protein [Pseudoclavibacter helvolus]|uniref:hypothetical protein n=1 Tax=Pseudoclavibacter helvolus TaxID=255205 RepID=UPI000838540A|nr:hypothetical protein [Pseudoclavibacter helvolus]
MPFEVFNKRNAPLAKAPSITIQKRGIFSINKAAHNLIGSADTVELLYDRDERIIGIRPAEMSPNAYQIRPQSQQRDSGQSILSATAFTQFYEVDTTITRRWQPYVEDGVLCIDLKGPSAEVRGNRAKREESDERIE